MLKNSHTLCMKGLKAQDLSANSEWKHRLVTFDTLHLSFFYAQVLLLEEALPRLETDLPKFQNANAFHIMTISFVRINFFNWQYFRYWPLGFCTDQQSMDPSMFLVYEGNKHFHFSLLVKISSWYWRYFTLMNIWGFLWLKNWPHQINFHEKQDIFTKFVMQSLCFSNLEKRRGSW